MTTPFSDAWRRPHLPWPLVWAAVRARECACTGCGSRDVRRSSVRTPLPLRIAGMHLWRCRECGALFPLRRRWLA